MPETEDDVLEDEVGNAVDADESEADLRVVIDAKLIIEAGDENPRPVPHGS